MYLYILILYLFQFLSRLSSKIDIISYLFNNEQPKSIIN